MGFYKTDKCFFIDKEVISCFELNEKEFLDGYYYRILYNDKEKEIRLNWDYDWNNDNWIKENGLLFFEKLEFFDKWEIFNTALDINMIKKYFEELIQ
jgi:hypothetical protein